MKIGYWLVSTAAVGVAIELCRHAIRARRPAAEQGLPSLLRSQAMTDPSIDGLLDRLRDGDESVAGGLARAFEPLWPLRIADAAHLRAFLARVVAYRLYDRARSALAQTGREERLGDRAHLLHGADARPSEYARAGAAWDALLAACPPEHRPILRLGYSREEIGEQLDLHPGSVRRALRHLARRFTFDPPPDPNPDSDDAP